MWEGSASRWKSVQAWRNGRNGGLVPPNVLKQHLCTRLTPTDSSAQTPPQALRRPDPQAKACPGRPWPARGAAGGRRAVAALRGARGAGAGGDGPQPGLRHRQADAAAVRRHRAGQRLGTPGHLIALGQRAFCFFLKKRRNLTSWTGAERSPRKGLGRRWRQSHARPLAGTGRACFGPSRVEFVKQLCEGFPAPPPFPGSVKLLVSNLLEQIQDSKHEERLHGQNNVNYFEHSL